MSDVYLGEDYYKNIAITEINEAINFCMINKLSKDKIKKIEKALDYLCSGVLYDSEILENEHSIKVGRLCFCPHDRKFILV